MAKLYRNIARSSKEYSTQCHNCSVFVYVQNDLSQAFIVEKVTLNLAK